MVAFLAGGRWNRPGTAMLYASQHLSLACLEVPVHLDKSELPPEYVLSSALLPREPDSLATEDVDSQSPCSSARTNWADNLRDLAVSVRSAVIPDEFNVLINPRHQDYREINWSSPSAFRFDPRLFAFKAQPNY
jgi:RES domain-containing protein